MPTVARYGTRRVSTAALPGVRKSAAESDISTGAGLAQAEGQAAAQKADALGRLGETIAHVGLGVVDERRTQQAAIAQAAAKEADDTALLDLDRQAADWENAKLHDATTGVLHTVKGKDAIGLDSTVGAEFDAYTGDLLAKMHPRTRLAAETLLHRRRASIVKGLETYGAEQSDQYAAAVAETSLTTSVQLAIANANTPGGDLRVVQELQRQEAIINTHAAQTHIPDEVRQAQIATARTSTHVGIITQLLALGEDRKAAAYFKDTKDEITGDKLAGVEKALDTATSEGVGLRAATAIWSQHGPKGESDPINLDTMEDAARAKFADDPKALKATIQQLRERKAGVDAGRQDRKEQIVGTLWSAVAQGATLADLRRMPEYVRAPGALQAQISEHVVNEAEQRANRAYTLSQRAEGEKSRVERAKEDAGWAMLWHYDTPEILSKMTDNQVLALTPDLGIAHVNRLMTKKRALVKGDDTVRAATIDEDLFKSTAQSAGLNPYGAKLSDSEKSALGQLRNTVETAIDQEQQRTGKTLTREAKQAVMAGIVDRKVMLDRWGTDTEALTATVINPKDRAVAYVPIEKIPEKHLSEWANVIRSISPRAQGLSTAEILRLYKAPIQRAHAAAVLRLGGDEELRRLKGE